jgi:hypothetical protein
MSTESLGMETTGLLLSVDVRPQAVGWAGLLSLLGKDQIMTRTSNGIQEPRTPLAYLAL